MAAAELMAVRLAGVPVDVTVEPSLQSNEEQRDALEAGPKRQSEWKTIKE